MASTEKRKFTRIPLETQINISCGKASIITNRFKDIGLGGAFVFTDSRIPLGTVCMVEIQILGPTSKLTMHVVGEVVRHGDDGMALSFTEIDVDSLIHLHHVIKINAQNPDVVEREFENELVGIKESGPQEP
jgi:hypothetical protein